MATPDPNAATSFGEDIKPYKIRISSKYLELTHQKLELTRLPHENSEPRNKKWWQPKPKVELIIDYWMEEYSWRDEETKLNQSVPQFRTCFLLPSLEGLQRLHFIHARSPHANAIPLLLIPPFPFTNLSLSYLIPIFTDPEDAGTNQPFHLVMPSLPGLGFSDSLPDNVPLIPRTAELFDLLMKRLGYNEYIATNSSSAADSPAQIDWKLANHIAIHFQDSCVGVNFISPSLEAPKFKKSPIAWVKWRIVKALKKPRWGYAKEDFTAIKSKSPSGTSALKTDTIAENTLGSLAIKEPNALAYALCDSPTGLLLFMLTLLRVMGSKTKFSPAEILTLIGWTWLPGAEGMLRYWAYCASTSEEPARAGKRETKPRVSITAFTEGGEPRAAEREENEDEDDSPSPENSTSYSCPQWASTKYQVMSVHRISAKPGLLAWERPEVILKGTRGLASALLATHKDLQSAEQPGQALLEQVVISGGPQGPADTSGTTVQAGSSATGSPRKPLSPLKGADLSPQKQPQHQGSPLRPVTPRRNSASQGSGSRLRGGSEEAESSPDTVIAIPPRISSAASN